MRIRLETWLALIVVGIGVVIAAVLGLWAYMSATAAPIHPSAQSVASVSRVEPASKWATAVESGRNVMRTGIVAQNLPGVSVAVGAAGEVVWAEGFGWTDLEKREPVSPETRFRIGSASKVLTSAAVGLLLEQKRLALDDEIQQHVPAYPRKEWPVTLRELMAHTAGVRNDAGDEEPVSQHCETMDDRLRRFADGKLLFEPGTKYHYSSYGWILVSAAVEAASREPFFTFMRKQVFEPIGMDDTKGDTDTTPASHLATYYFPKFAADPRYGPQEPEPVDYSCFAGSDGFISTPSDLVRFGMAVNGGKLLQPSTAQLLQASQRLRSGEETGYGLGWDLEDATIADVPVRVVGHDGELRGGMVASLVTFANRDVVVAVVSNTSYADTYHLALKVAESFLAPESRPASK